MEQQQDTQVKQTQTVAETQPEQVETQTAETAETEQSPEGTTVEGGETQTEQTQTEDQFVLRTKIGEQEEAFDIRNEEQKKKLAEFAQKGIDYTKKMQSLAEMEKQLQQERQIARQVQADPSFMKMQLAKLQGLDPSVVFTNPQPPPDWLKTSDPDSWANADSQYRFNMQAKQLVDAAYQQYARLTSESTNQTVFNKARLEFSLNDDEMRRLESHVRAKIMPDTIGAYSFDDISTQYWALFGKDKIASEKLKTADKINKTIQQAGQASTARSVQERPVKKTPEEAGASKFLKYVEESVKH